MLLIILLNPFFSASFSGSFGRFLGHQGTKIISVWFLFINFSFVIFCFYLLCNNSLIELSNLGLWIISNYFLVNWNFSIEMLTIIMLLVVNSISFLVHLYSTKYMEQDPHIVRFFSYISLFTFFMLILVLGDNLLILFLGWEGIGMCSYLLISFWYTRVQANKSALKAIIVNRISDFGVTLGIISIFYFITSIDFGIILVLCDFLANYSISINKTFYVYAISIISFLLFTGAIGKSAQLSLHTWLPDAMEGPTPVSALLHAATMVTAGVFLIIKCSMIIENSYTVLNIISYFGAVTAFFAATSGLFLSDIKKIIAYSTCSQSGYMVFSCGISAYNVSLFHLVNHAVFKALLFLGAGAIIHAVSNEQDMRRMGNLIKILPMTYSVFLVATLAIIGFPFLTGFFSKDIIIENTINFYSTKSLILHFFAIVTAFFTAVYSFKIIYFVFLIKANLLKISITFLHEAALAMSVPLHLLAFGSIYIGFLLKDVIIGSGSIIITNISVIKSTQLFETEFISILLKNFPFFLSFLAIICLNFYIFYNKQFNIFFNKNFYKFLLFFYNRWNFDRIYNKFINYKIMYFALKYIYINIDKGFLEFFGPFGIFKISKKSIKFLRIFQTGSLSLYLQAMTLFPLLFTFYLISNATFNEIIFFNPLFILLYKIKTTNRDFHIKTDNFFKTQLTLIKNEIIQIFFFHIYSLCLTLVILFKLCWNVTVLKCLLFYELFNAYLERQKILLEIVKFKNFTYISLLYKKFYINTKNKKKRFVKKRINFLWNTDNFGFFVKSKFFVKNTMSFFVNFFNFFVHLFFKTDLTEILVEKKKIKIFQNIYYDLLITKSYFFFVDLSWFYHEFRKLFLKYFGNLIFLIKKYFFIKNISLKINEFWYFNKIYYNKLLNVSLVKMRILPHLKKFVIFFEPFYVQIKNLFKTFFIYLSFKFNFFFFKNIFFNFYYVTFIITYAYVSRIFLKYVLQFRLLRIFSRCALQVYSWFFAICSELNIDFHIETFIKKYPFISSFWKNLISYNGFLQKKIKKNLKNFINFIIMYKDIFLFFSDFTNSKKKVSNLQEDIKLNFFFILQILPGSFFIKKKIKKYPKLFKSVLIFFSAQKQKEFFVDQIYSFFDQKTINYEYIRNCKVKKIKINNNTQRYNKARFFNIKTISFNYISLQNEKNIFLIFKSFNKLRVLKENQQKFLPLFSYVKEEPFFENNFERIVDIHNISSDLLNIKEYMELIFLFDIISRKIVNEFENNFELFSLQFPLFTFFFKYVKQLLSLSQDIHKFYTKFAAWRFDMFETEEECRVYWKEVNLPNDKQPFLQQAKLKSMYDKIIFALSKEEPIILHVIVPDILENIVDYEFTSIIDEMIENHWDLGIEKEYLDYLDDLEIENEDFEVKRLRLNEKIHNAYINYIFQSPKDNNLIWPLKFFPFSINYETIFIFTKNLENKKDLLKIWNDRVWKINKDLKKSNINNMEKEEIINIGKIDEINTERKMKEVKEIYYEKIDYENWDYVTNKTNQIREINKMSAFSKFLNFLDGENIDWFIFYNLNFIEFPKTYYSFLYNTFNLFLKLMYPNINKVLNFSKFLSFIVIFSILFIFLLYKSIDFLFFILNSEILILLKILNNTIFNNFFFSYSFIYYTYNYVNSSIVLLFILLINLFFSCLIYKSINIQYFSYLNKIITKFGKNLTINYYFWNLFFFIKQLLKVFVLFLFCIINFQLFILLMFYPVFESFALKRFFFRVPVKNVPIYPFYDFWYNQKLSFNKAILQPFDQLWHSKFLNSTNSKSFLKKRRSYFLYEYWGKLKQKGLKKIKHKNFDKFFYPKFFVDEINKNNDSFWWKHSKNSFKYFFDGLWISFLRFCREVRGIKWKWIGISIPRLEFKRPWVYWRWKKIGYFTSRVWDKKTKKFKKRRLKKYAWKKIDNPTWSVKKELLFRLKEIRIFIKKVVIFLWYSPYFLIQFILGQIPKKLNKAFKNFFKPLNFFFVGLKIKFWLFLQYRGENYVNFMYFLQDTLKIKVIVNTLYITIINYLNFWISYLLNFFFFDIDLNYKLFKTRVLFFHKIYKNPFISQEEIIEPKNKLFYADFIKKFKKFNTVEFYIGKRYWRKKFKRLREHKLRKRWKKYKNYLKRLNKIAKRKKTIKDVALIKKRWFFSKRQKLKSQSRRLRNLGYNPFRKHEQATKDFFKVKKVGFVEKKVDKKKIKNLPFLEWVNKWLSIRGIPAIYKVKNFPKKKKNLILERSFFFWKFKKNIHYVDLSSNLDNKFIPLKKNKESFFFANKNTNKRMLHKLHLDFIKLPTKKGFKRSRRREDLYNALHIKKKNKRKRKFFVYKKKYKRRKAIFTRKFKVWMWKKAKYFKRAKLTDGFYKQYYSNLDQKKVMHKFTGRTFSKYRHKFYRRSNRKTRWKRIRMWTRRQKKNCLLFNINTFLKRSWKFERLLVKKKIENNFNISNFSNKLNKLKNFGEKSTFLLGGKRRKIKIFFPLSHRPFKHKIHTKAKKTIRYWGKTPRKNVYYKKASIYGPNSRIARKYNDKLMVFKGLPKKIQKLFVNKSKKYSRWYFEDTEIWENFDIEITKKAPRKVESWMADLKTWEIKKKTNVKKKVYPFKRYNFIFDDTIDFSKSLETYLECKNFNSDRPFRFLSQITYELSLRKERRFAGKPFLSKDFFINKRFINFFKSLMHQYSDPLYYINTFIPKTWRTKIITSINPDLQSWDILRWHNIKQRIKHIRAWEPYNRIAKKNTVMNYFDDDLDERFKESFVQDELLKFRKYQKILKKTRKRFKFNHAYNRNLAQYFFFLNVHKNLQKNKNKFYLKTLQEDFIVKINNFKRFYNWIRNNLFIIVSFIITFLHLITNVLLYFKQYKWILLNKNFYILKSFLILFNKMFYRFKIKSYKYCIFFQKILELYFIILSNFTLQIYAIFYIFIYKIFISIKKFFIYPFFILYNKQKFYYITFFRSQGFFDNLRIWNDNLVSFFYLGLAFLINCWFFSIMAVNLHMLYFLTLSISPIVHLIFFFDAYHIVYWWRALNFF